MDEKDARTPRDRHLTTRQGWHLAGLIILAIPVYAYAVMRGVPIWLALSAPVTAALHQGLVALVWRSQLLWSLPSRRLGRWALPLFGACFFLLLGLRLISTVALSVATRGDAIPRPPLYVLATVIAYLGLRTIQDVFVHFGVVRALGADHFFPEYRSLPWVREGMFRYTPNAMYTFGTALFLMPGLFAASGPGLAAGLYHYAAIWVHYWATEKPDMDHIYSRR